ncbi:MAG: type III-B CRISPR module-associated protein Cmr5 [Bacteroidota bacterium]
MPLDPFKTLDQQRAKAAWAATEGVTSEFTKLAEGAAATIVASGLLQALAFYLAKGGKHADLAAVLADWALRAAPPTGSAAARATALMTDLLRRDSTHLRRQTAETLAYLTWVKRFAKARTGA